MNYMCIVTVVDDDYPHKEVGIMTNSLTEARKFVKDNTDFPYVYVDIYEIREVD